MQAYDAGLFDPPAPVARMVLRSRVAGAAIPDVPMLIDSGADVTLVPRVCINKLGVALDPDLAYELMAFDGTTSSR